jgi:predicted enzyme related to lactoylglutathione lyase
LVRAQLPTTCFALIWAGYSDRLAGSASGVNFEVDDIDDAVASLAANGVTIGELFDGPICRSASFCDPEGNKLTIHQSKVRSPG